MTQGGVGDDRRGLEGLLMRLARRPPPPLWRSAAIGAGLGGLFLILRLGLGVVLGDATGFLVLLPSILVAALVAGRAGALAALVVSVIGGWALVHVGPAEVISDQRRLVTTINFVVVGLFAGWAAAALRRAIRESDAAMSARSESEERFRLMADTAPSPVWMTDAEARVEFANQALVEFYGQPASEILGHVWRLSLHPDDIATVDAIQKKARPSRLPYAFEARFQRGDGVWRWMRCSDNPRFGADGEFLGYVGMSFDISEQREALAEARESERRFRVIADTAPVLIWVTAQDRSREFVNQAYVAFMGGDYETVRTADWRTYVHADDQARLVAESLAGEATLEPFSLEARYLRHDGEHRWLKSFSRPRFGLDGEVIGFVGVAFDVTEARQAQEDLTRINELLEDRVGDALAEKAKAEADLMHAQRMEAVGRLTGGVAHDFNNLLTVVIGALDIMLRTDDAAKRKKLGEAALSAARRGESLTHQLLAFSRRQALRPEAVDLNAQILQGEPLLRRALGAGVDFRLDLSTSPVRANVDPAQFEAALLNLVVNAGDAVGETGTVTVATGRHDLDADAHPGLAAGDYACVLVRDDGVGMPPEVLSRVFEPFFTTKPVGKGTGLGLSQVYGFARQSGGDIRIRSTPGKGAEITLWLPALSGEAPPPPAPAAETASPRPGAEGRLLLVEDDPAVAEVAQALLTEMGYRVVTVGSAPEALRKLKRGAFPVMLTDVVMPGGMSGIELARAAAELHPQMRIVLTSGYAGEDVDRALAGAPWPFLRKPYSAQGLAEAVRPSED